MPEEALNDYVPVLMLLVFAVSFAAINLLASWALGKRAPTNVDKDSAFECGMLPLEQGRRRFSVRFYVVAMLFVALTALRALAGQSNSRHVDGVQAAAVYWHTMVVLYGVVWYAIFITK